MGERGGKAEKGMPSRVGGGEMCACVWACVNDSAPVGRVREGSGLDYSPPGEEKEPLTMGRIRGEEERKIEIEQARRTANREERLNNRTKLP